MNKRKADTISVFVIVILLGAFYSLFLKDDLSTHRSLRQKKTSIQETINRDTSILEREKKKVVNILNLEKEVQGHRLFLSKENKVPYFLNHVSSLARRYHVEVLSIEPGETMDIDLFTRSTFTAELRGGFPYLYQFLYHLEEDWRGVKVENLTIDKSAGDNGVNIRLKLAVLSIEGPKEKA